MNSRAAGESRAPRRRRTRTCRRSARRTAPSRASCGTRRPSASRMPRDDDVSPRPRAARSSAASMSSTSICGSIVTPSRWASSTELAARRVLQRRSSRRAGSAARCGEARGSSSRRAAARGSVADVDDLVAHDRPDVEARGRRSAARPCRPRARRSRTRLDDLGGVLAHAAARARSGGGRGTRRRCPCRGSSARCPNMPKVAMPPLQLAHARRPTRAPPRPRRARASACGRSVAAGLGRLQSAPDAREERDARARPPARRTCSRQRWLRQVQPLGGRAERAAVQGGEEVLELLERHRRDLEDSSKLSQGYAE